MLEGVGNIVEVDESGFFPGRGYKVDNQYAVSYTDYCEHRITRGNDNPNDDFVIRPGQTWCVISSAVEGDTHVTVYAPEIHNWDKHKVFVTKHWVDAEWTSAAARDQPRRHASTRSRRSVFRPPIASRWPDYRVRYRILDGPPAVFLPSREQVTQPQRAGGQRPQRQRHASRSRSRAGAGRQPHRHRDHPAAGPARPPAARHRHRPRRDDQGVGAPQVTVSKVGPPASASARTFPTPSPSPTRARSRAPAHDRARP